MQPWVELSPRGRRAARLAAALGVLCPFGCTDDASVGDQGFPRWLLSDRPIVEIGAEGDARYEFHRVVGVATLAGGDIVVGDGGAPDVRIYDASGEFLRSFGRTGDGPGEFRYLAGLDVWGDSIVAFERGFGPARVHVFDLAGGVLLGTSLRPDGEPPVTVLTALAPDILVVLRGAGPRVPTLPPLGVVQRDTVNLGLLRVGPPQSVTWIGEFLNRSHYSYPLPPGLPAERAVALYPLGPSLVLGSSGGRLWIGDSGTGQIEVLDTTGSRVTEMQFVVPPQSFDEAALQDARAIELAEIADPDPHGRRASVETRYSPAMLPPTAPRFTRFVAGPDGEMWVEQFSEHPVSEHEVVVLDRTGMAVGQVTIPAGVTLHAVDYDRVVGVRKDEVNADRIVVYRLSRRNVSAGSVPDGRGPDR